MTDFSDWFSIQPFDWTSVAACLVCGSVIGFERQIRGKPMGIRTSSLIVLATYMFVRMSLYLDLQATSVDPTRVIGQVVTGVGFLGAGVMMTRDGTVMGVTSAATIWVLAALGVCIAMGSNVTALKLSILVLFILCTVHALERTTTALRRGVHTHIEQRRDRE